MDGRQGKLNRSLQRNLNRLILSAVLAFSLLAGALSGWMAFQEARELQDTLLQQVAALAASQSRQVSLPGNFDPENTLVLQRLGDTDTRNLPLPVNLTDGLHTMNVGGTSWRVFVYTKPGSVTNPEGRFAVSQQTEVRDEVAWESSLHTFLPILLLAPILMAVVSFSVSQGFKPVTTLAKVVDNRDEGLLDDLPEQYVPQELLPFTHSINNLLTRLRQAISQQQRFVADAAHELRTPVAAISLLVENAANTDTLAQMRERLEPVHEGLDRLRSLVSHLLDLARLQAENQSPPDTVNIQHIVESVIAEIYPLAEAKSIDLGMLRNESMAVVDMANSLKLLVRNALENAVRYTPAGGKVDVNLYAEAGQAIFSVEDNGHGIPEAELLQVFKPFYRGSDNTEPGNGLGLAISDEIARRLHGIIRLENREPHGLMFEYRQPILKDAL